VHATGFRGFEHRRAGAPHASHLDPLLGGILGQLQLARAVRQHRLVRLGQVELPLVELGDVREQLGGGFVLSRGLGGEFPAKNLVAQVRQREAVHGVTFDGGGWSRADA
jgi:hypothetical protein